MFRRLVFVVFCGALISSCFEPPEYPFEPEITFRSIKYVEVADLPNGESMADSLILTIRFRDGDGNLGLTSTERRPPYNDRWYYVREPLNLDDKIFPENCRTYAAQHRCWFVPVPRPEYMAEFNKYIDYSSKRANVAPYDTLKPFIKPYNCENWEVIRDDDDKIVDTLYFTLNKHYSNIFVEFQTKNGDNTYTPFDWGSFLTYPSCEVQGFNGRFPLLNNPSDATPLEGDIKYAMPSPFFRIIFGAKTLRLRVYIEDRALNKSNEIFTDDFNFQ